MNELRDVCAAVCAMCAVGMCSFCFCFGCMPFALIFMDLTNYMPHESSYISQQQQLDYSNKILTTPSTNVCCQQSDAGNGGWVRESVVRPLFQSVCWAAIHI